jgi:hypothetical protein
MKRVRVNSRSEDTMDNTATEFEDELADLITKFQKKGLDDEAIVSSLETRVTMIEDGSGEEQDDDKRDD